jgi:hypothetical protein
MIRHITQEQLIGEPDTELLQQDHTGKYIGMKVEQRAALLGHHYLIAISVLLASFQEALGNVDKEVIAMES